LIGQLQPYVVDESLWLDDQLLWLDDQQPWLDEQEHFIAEPRLFIADEQRSLADERLGVVEPFQTHRRRFASSRRGHSGVPPAASLLLDLKA
jgi:hypothetical protein